MSGQIKARDGFGEVRVTVIRGAKIELSQLRLQLPLANLINHFPSCNNVSHFQHDQHHRTTLLPDVQPIM